uniref:G-protein coupled receptor Mth-like protein 1 n=1 Tax=Dastarcus helophoroides TaxID=1169899 RepID=A0A0A7P873_9CUCU|nr:G-protein coupled receptor Mth-like protein 1 [Dastarcus helophoroides]
MRTYKLLLCLFFAVVSGKNVTIQKCCKLTQFLSSSMECIHQDRNVWNLNVYSPTRGSFLPKDKIPPPNWHIKEGFKPSCKKPKFIYTNIGAYVPFQNGSLLIIENSKFISPPDYCLNYKGVIFCVQPDDDKGELMSRVRVKKCCGENAIFSETNRTCIHIKDKGYVIDVGANKTLSEGFPNCHHHHIAVGGHLKDSKLFENGSLWISHYDTLVSMGNFCLEYSLENAGSSPMVMVCSDTLRIEKPTTDIRFVLYPIGLAFSAVFLAATLAAGYLLPASHHVLHWRCQTNYVTCLLIGDILLCIIHLSTQISHTWCIAISTPMHFSFLAAFFWLNTMCFNIWWTFRDLRPQSVEKSQERCRLRLYEVYAWGVPLVIAGTAAILDIVATEENNLLRPNFGKSSCWFHGDTEKLTFFYGPIGVLLIINLALFGLTARELTCGLWKRELVKSTTERAALGRVCMKLVVVMGVTWIFDIISWAIGGPQELWYFSDFLNSLQGVFIFIVIGCQPQVLSAVKRIWCLRKHRENGNVGTSNHHSSSSQGLPSIGDTMTNSVSNNTKSMPLETSC